MRVTAPVVLLGLFVGGGIVASAQAPAGKGWTDTFAVDKKDFVSVGSNDFFRLEPGYVLTLEKGKVRLVITVLDETKLVDGVETRVVEERESKGGALAEISRNHFAFNTADRGVYYFGEEVDIYKNGKVVGHEGAWESGKGGARFGLMIPGRPVVGARFYQEVAPGVAMDRAEVAALDASIKTPAGVFEGCLKFIETTPIEPFARESKIYAPGIGLVKDGSLLLVEHGRKEQK
ncbi:MAG: hypothetical protein HGA94_06455 [Candidatus Aminicenantes bacterium]|nr:hypothetical protein [Candidatus Aminicenantes bacterium]